MPCFDSVIYLVVFCFLLFMCQWCFFKALFTEVAVVPFQVIDDDNDFIDVQEIILKFF